MAHPASDGRTSEPTTPAVPGRSIRRVARWLIPLGLLLAIGYLLHMPTQELRLSDGRRFAVLQVDRNTQIRLDPSGVQLGTEQRLLVKYYSEEHDVTAMLAEARDLAPSLFRVADSLGLATLLVKPSRPLFLRAFPLAVISYDVRFVRDSTGQWRESTAAMTNGGA